MSENSIDDHHLEVGRSNQKPVLTGDVAQRLDDISSARRAQSDNIVGIVKKVIDRLKTEAIRRISAEAEAAKWKLKCEELQDKLVDQQNIFDEDYAKLSDGYKVAVSALEEARVSGTNTGDRINRILLNYDLGLARNLPTPPSSHVRNFTEKAFGYQPYPLNPIDIIERDFCSLDTSHGSKN